MMKICVVTGTRAEYGLLKPIIDRIYRNKNLQLQLVVTGMHLSTEFGYTYQEIEADGYPITAKIEMLLSSDTPTGITKSMGVELIGLADYFESHRPDIVVILGDRYEMLMVATAAMIARVPIAHIHGGELTEGLIDEAIRHSITKMSHLHFTTTCEYRNRVIQLGENPSSVYQVGALGIENIKIIKLLSRVELERELKFTFDKTTLMVTYHPLTLECETAQKQFANILNVFDLHPEIKLIFTKANSDTNGRIINQMIDDYVSKNAERSIAFTSMGQMRYLSALQFCACVIGNSSSGIIEVPSFGIPTINIGDRQKGRICAESVMSCGNDIQEIEAALSRSLSHEFRVKANKCNNPYEGKNTSETILQVIVQALHQGIKLKKTFYDIGTK